MKLRKFKSILRNRVRKTNKLDKSTEAFYIFDNSCQIPNLNSIYIQIFGEDTNRICLEVGAYDGITCSNSYGLALRGWNVFLIEPISEYALLAKKRFMCLSNVHVYEFAISNQEEILDFFQAGSLTTANQKLFEIYKTLDWAKSSILPNPTKLKVKAMTLNSFIQRNLPDKTIDVLIIDTEGFENKVMAGFDLELYLPKLVIIELADFHPDLNHMNNSAREIYFRFVDVGYSVIFKDPINTIFVQTKILKEKINSL